MLRKEQLGKHGSHVSDDEPLYDSVASDDDYVALTCADNNPSDILNQLKVNEVINEVSYYLIIIIQEIIKNLVF
jgi:G protein-coupled receptor kinase interacting protein 2